jgi:hypothetical protein
MKKQVSAIALACVAKVAWRSLIKEWNQLESSLSVVEERSAVGAGDADR